MMLMMLMIYRLAKSTPYLPYLTSFWTVFSWTEGEVKSCWINPGISLSILENFGSSTPSSSGIEARQKPRERHSRQARAGAGGEYFFSEFIFMSKGGRWECHCKYIEPNCYSYFLRIQCINRRILAAITLEQSLKATTARIHLLIDFMLSKWPNQFSSMYLQWHSQRPPWLFWVLFTALAHCGQTRIQPLRFDT